MQEAHRHGKPKFSYYSAEEFALLFFVIPNEARNLSLLLQIANHGVILRFGQNDKNMGSLCSQSLQLDGNDSNVFPAWIILPRVVFELHALRPLFFDKNTVQYLRQA